MTTAPDRTVPAGQARGLPERLPDFVILGAQKAGTTWLARNLSQHPDIYLPPREVRYFDRGEHFARGPDWYAAHFAPGVDARQVGEKSADYLWVTRRRVGDHLPEIPQRLHAILPHARLVAILREPVARAASSARHYLRLGRIPPHLTLDEVLVGRHRGVGQRLGLIDRGRYMTALAAYLRHYDRSRLLVLIHEEDVVGNPRGALRRVCGFLGVDPGLPFPQAERPVAVTRWSLPAAYLRHYLPPWAHRQAARMLERHVPRQPPLPSPETVDHLRRLYAPENRRLYEFLGRIPAGWPPEDGGE